jgi:alpha-tubulin suppressor-like RCC1 family protein
VTVGYAFACALTTLGGVECWGDNNLGQLGNGTKIYSSTPVQVQGLTSGVLAVSAGGPESAGGFDAYNSACAITASGGVVCWGSNLEGKLGNGTTTTSPVPVPVSNLGAGVTAISVGVFATCAVTAGGGVMCWGHGQEGELGNNSTAYSAVPVQVSNLTSGVTAVSVGSYSACALKTDGTVLCWGSNDYLVLGNGSREATASLVPAPVIGLGGPVTAISIGTESVCAVVTGGAVECWGDDLDDALGVGAVTGPNFASDAPIALTTLSSGVTSVSVGDLSACAILANGGLDCWGYDNNGQLGNNSTLNQLLPVQITGLPGNVRSVAISATVGCAATTTGAVACWGKNALGSSTTSNSLVPVPVVGFP